MSVQALRGQSFFRTLVAIITLMLFVGVASAEVARTSGLLAAGTEWENPYYIIDSGVEGPTLLVTAGMHGSEPGGSHAAEQMRHWTVQQGKLIVVPRVNTPGLKKRTRWLPGLPGPISNANRNFPREGEACEARSVPSKALWEFAEKQKPDWVVDLHEGSDFHIANPEKGGSSIIFFDTPEMQEFVAKMIEAVNATIEDPKRKFAKIPKGPVNGGLVRAAIQRLGAKGCIIESCRKDQPIATRARHHQVLVTRLMRELKMIDASCVNVMTSPTESE